MRKILFMIVFAAGAVCAAEAKIKIVERSAKKTPAWVGASQQEAVITQAFAGDLESAKTKCMEQVRAQIIRAVADNVAASSSGSIAQTIEGGAITKFVDSFVSTYQTRSADVPFLKGISPSKIEAFYWEKQLDTDTGAVKFLYAVKYPLPSVELKQLVLEFEKRDEEFYAKFIALEQGLDKVESLEAIDRAITDLGPITDYFFDATRKNAARALAESYRKLYNSVAFRVDDNSLGKHSFVLTLDGRVITTSQRMTARSDGATELTVQTEGPQIVVRYNYAGAEWDVENVVTVNVRIGGRSVPHKFSFYVKKLMQ